MTSQRQLTFDGTRETLRQASVERILATVPRVETAARSFDEQAERDAARRATEPQNQSV